MSSEESDGEVNENIIIDNYDNSVSSEWKKGDEEDDGQFLIGDDETDDISSLLEDLGLDNDDSVDNDSSSDNNSNNEVKEYNSPSLRERVKNINLDDELSTLDIKHFVGNIIKEENEGKRDGEKDNENSMLRANTSQDFEVSFDGGEDGEIDDLIGKYSIDNISGINDHDYRSNTLKIDDLKTLDVKNFVGSILKSEEVIQKKLKEENKGSETSSGEDSQLEEDLLEFIKKEEKKKKKSPRKRSKSPKKRSRSPRKGSKSPKKREYYHDDFVVVRKKHKKTPTKVVSGEFEIVNKTKTKKTQPPKKKKKNLSREMNTMELRKKGVIVLKDRSIAKKKEEKEIVVLLPGATTPKSRPSVQRKKVLTSKSVPKSNTKKAKTKGDKQCCLIM